VTARSTKAVFVLATAGVIAAMVMLWPDQKMISRDIGCAHIGTEREKNVCQALSDSMEWTWMGHAILSPGWRVTWDTVRRAYCRENMSVADLSILEALKKGPDWRLQEGADDLIRLISSGSGGATEPENSIFNPANPQYILKGGCGAVRTH
jgi:hypothetical protein